MQWTATTDLNSPRSPVKSEGTPPSTPAEQVIVSQYSYLDENQSRFGSLPGDKPRGGISDDGNCSGRQF